MIKICNQEMCDVAITIIGKYIDEHICEVVSTYPNDIFENSSYARWAVYEIIDRLNSEAKRLSPHITESGREPIPPIDIVAGFLEEMECYMFDSRGEPHKHIFSIAKEVGNDIIQLFL